MCSRRVDMQQSILAKYLEKFQLTNGETETLNQPDITMEFFNAFEKTHIIHNNCQILLQSGSQTLALRIMEQIASIQVKILIPSTFYWNIRIVTAFLFVGNCHWISVSLGANTL